MADAAVHGTLVLSTLPLLTPLVLQLPPVVLEFPLFVAVAGVLLLEVAVAVGIEDDVAVEVVKVVVVVDDENELIRPEEVDVDAVEEVEAAAAAADCCSFLTCSFWPRVVTPLVSDLIADKPPPPIDPALALLLVVLFC